MTRRAVIGLAAAVATIGLFTSGLAWLLEMPKPPPGASQGERLFYAFCSPCHGVDGRGTWRAALFLIRPGDLTDRERMARDSDQYLFDIIKHGGAPIGRPGMPGFEQLSDAEIQALVQHLRQLSDTGR